MRAFRSGWLVLAAVVLGTTASAARQSPPPAPPDQREKPAAQQSASPAPSASVTAPADAPLILPPGSLESEPASAKSDVTPPGAAGSSRPVKKGGLNFYSPERELQMGKQLDGQMLQHVQLLYDPMITDYLEDVAARIARNSDVEVPVVLRVVESSVPDSFSLPGGYIYITLGMVQTTRTEAELAAILSHEVAHISCRHATRQMTKQQMLSLMAIPLMFASGPVAFAVGETFSLAYPFTLLKFSRNAESEADALGVAYMSATGYDPNAAISLFERVASQEKTNLPGLRRLFSTHPISKDRLAAVSRAIARLPARQEYVVSTSQYEEVVGRLLRMGYNNKPEIPTLIRRTGPEDSEP
jgi:predicted Zn-dependent protease